MKTISKLIILISYCLFISQLQAQTPTTANDSVAKAKQNNIEEIKVLEASKEKVRQEEKEHLKTIVQDINRKLEHNEFTKEKADALKKAMAKTIALNIDNRIAIIDNKIALLQRNYNGYEIEPWKDPVDFFVGAVKTDKSSLTVGLKIPKLKKIEEGKTIRTFNSIVLAFGLNNTIIDELSIGDTPFELGGSRFFEVGYQWKTRVFKNTNFVRFNYGFSLQINGLRQKDNLSFVEENNSVQLEEFRVNLRKSKLSVTNIVIPLHFEFGPSHKYLYGKNKNSIAYDTYSKFNIGLGGYAGFNIGARQKLKFRDTDGINTKEKQRGFNVTRFVYGLSSYIGIGEFSLYAKYDLSPIFRNQAIKQNNISLGVRFNFSD